ncbi:MAG: hypothetical protein DSY50_05540 [Desulfobulbus sp.]|nr:MAG: hypothetical protein DSY50_05540 [Desulfobulbus sp.]
MSDTAQTKQTTNQADTEQQVSNTVAHSAQEIDLSDVGQGETPEESLEEILLQELLQKTTELQQSTKKLSKLQHELSITRHIVACQDKGIIFINPSRKILYTNTVFCDMAGLDLRELQKETLDALIVLRDTDQPLSSILQKTSGLEKWQGKILLKTDQANQTLYLLSIDYCKKNVKKSIPEGFVCQFSQVEEHAPSPSSIGSSALFTHDSLTGLPDRSSFQHHLALCVNQARLAGSRVGLLYIDLDNFKRINQMMGPACGDDVLCQVTQLLQQNANAEGINFIARLSSDEFAIILPPPSGPEQTAKLAERIISNFQLPLNVNSRDMFITPSIGITLFPEDGDNPSELLRNADAAMEIIKAKGGNNSCRWQNDIDDTAIENLHLENDLRHAVANHEIFNYYQPQIDLINGKIIGMEALARWEHPEHGFVSPEVFIPLAVNAGLIDELGIELVRQACEDGRQWMQLGFRNFVMAVNLSGRLLRRLDLFDHIIDCLESTGFPADHLEVEFTESVLIENIDNTIDLINKCREKGIKMAIDDFGTGYSSLSYLQRFAVDKIKIDRSFIMDVTTNPGDAAITMAIIAIAKKLHFEVLAEGVETEEQLFFLQDNQCDSCQGFLFSKPISGQRMKNLLMRDASVALKHRRILDKFYSIKAGND